MQHRDKRRHGGQCSLLLELLVCLIVASAMCFEMLVMIGFGLFPSFIIVLIIVVGITATDELCQ